MLIYGEIEREESEHADVIRYARCKDGKRIHIAVNMGSRSVPMKMNSVLMKAVPESRDVLEAYDAAVWTD